MTLYFVCSKMSRGLGLKQIHHTSHQVIPSPSILSLTTWNDPCWPSSIPTSRQQSHSDRQQVPGNFKAYQTTWSCHENPKASGNHDHDIECYYCYSLLYDSYMTFNAVIWRRVMSHGMSQETSRWSIAAERTCDLRVVAAWRNSGIGRFASGGLMPLKPFVFFLLPGIMLRCNDVIWCNDVNCELKSVMSSCHPLGIETQTNCSLEFHFIMAFKKHISGMSIAPWSFLEILVDLFWPHLAHHSAWDAETRFLSGVLCVAPFCVAKDMPPSAGRAVQGWKNEELNVGFKSTAVVTYMVFINICVYIYIYIHKHIYEYIYIWI